MTTPPVLLRDALAQARLRCRRRHLGQAALEHLRTTPADVVVTDVQMAGMSGIELCQELRQRHPDLLPIVLTGPGGLDTAIAAIRAGAYDFITKPVKVDALAIAVGRAIEHLVAEARGQAAALGRRPRRSDRRHRRQRARRSARRSR